MPRLACIVSFLLDHIFRFSADCSNTWGDFQGAGNSEFTATEKISARSQACYQLRPAFSRLPYHQRSDCINVTSHVSTFRLYRVQAIASPFVWCHNYTQSLYMYLYLPVIVQFCTCTVCDTGTLRAYCAGIITDHEGSTAELDATLVKLKDHQLGQSSACIHCLVYLLIMHFRAYCLACWHHCILSDGLHTRTIATGVLIELIVATLSVCL